VLTGRLKLFETAFCGLVSLVDRFVLGYESNTALFCRINALLILTTM
jgi:hypothetical protein